MSYVAVDPDTTHKITTRLSRSEVRSRLTLKGLIEIGSKERSFDGKFNASDLHRSQALPHGVSSSTHQRSVFRSKLNSA